MNIFLKLILFFLPLILLFIFIFHPIIGMDQDLGRHFLNGKIILESWTVPNTNLFSYTYPDFPFVNHHWLSEVLLYEVHAVFGFEGLFLLQMLLFTAPFLIVFFYSLRKGANIYAVTITSLLYIQILLERTHLRPELFSFLLLSLYIILLYRFREKSTKLIFILPLLQLLWVNLHIYFFIGIVVTGLFFVDILITKRKALVSFLKHKSSLPSPVIIIGLVLGGVFLVSFANPNGAQGALYPLFVFNNYGYSIEENQNVWFLWNYSQKATILFYFVSALLLWSGLFLARKKVRPIDFLLSFVFTILAATQIRNFPLFVYATFIACVFSWSSLTSSFKNIYNKYLFLIFFLFVLIAFSLFFYGIHTATEKVGFGYGVSESGKNAIDFFQKNKLPSPIFNNFDIGSYIEYRLYPKEKVFVDGRPEAYPSSFFQNIYIPMQEKKEIFKQIANQYGFNSIVFSHIDQTPWGVQFVSDITKNKQWNMVYIDDTFLILVKDTSKNKKITRNFSLDEKNFKIPKQYTQDTMSILKFARFFSIVQWQQQEEHMFSLLLEKNPNSCIALENLTRLLALRNDPAVLAFSSRLTNCKD